MTLPILGFAPNTGTPFLALQNVFIIFQGDSPTINGGLFQGQNGGYLPVDLTLCTSVTLSLYNADGSVLQLAATIGATPVLGQFSATITAAQSALLNVGQYQNIDVQFVFPSVTYTVQFSAALSVMQVA